MSRDPRGKIPKNSDIGADYGSTMLPADPADSVSPRVVQFDSFTLDLARRVLSRRGERIHLTAKPLDTLIALVTRPGGSGVEEHRCHRGCPGPGSRRDPAHPGRKDRRGPIHSDGSSTGLSLCHARSRCDAIGHCADPRRHARHDRASFLDAPGSGHVARSPLSNCGDGLARVQTTLSGWMACRRMGRFMLPG